MINANLSVRNETQLKHLIVKAPYAAPKYDQWRLEHLSAVAQKVLRVHYPSYFGKYITADQPEIIALRLLDFLSSRQGYIRRKGLSFRTESFYAYAVPKLMQQIDRGLPIELNSLCLCTTLANKKYAGESPYPHMGAFIALENLHKIALGARAIYEPGLRMTLGYEGALFGPLYFHSDSVVHQSLKILRQLNDAAAHNVWQGKENPIRIVDALWMIERSFGSVATFSKRVEALAPNMLEDATVVAWREWYDQTVSDYFFPSREERERFIAERSRWRQAVLHLKYNEGIFGGGFMNYGDNAMTFTPSGRRLNMLALQLIPENPHLPHQRVVTYDPSANKWRTAAFTAIETDSVVYAPRYVGSFSYPFYFEKITTHTTS